MYSPKTAHLLPASPGRAKFIPAKPADAKAAPPSPVNLLSQSNGAVARLTKQFSVVSKEPQQGTMQSNKENHPIIKARLTSLSVSRKKPTLPGAGHADNARPLLPAVPQQYQHDVQPVEITTLEDRPASDSVTVCIRAKPNQQEKAWTINCASSLVSAVGPRSDLSFRFDGVSEDSDNVNIYHTAAKRLVKQAMRGFDAVAFAYGQTATGKTFTLTGTRDNPGITPQAVADIFKHIRDHGDREYLLRASYLEIYNESLRDLLAPETASLIKIRQNEQKQFFVSPLREEIVTSEGDISALLLRGEANRHVGSTDYNERSSRSHVLLQITIESRDVGDDVPARSTTPLPRRATMPKHTQSLAGSKVKISRLSLIDLAGCEKATSQQDRRMEGAFINKSLLTLEKVVSALTEEKQRSHIPFRDSKLTQILQSSLSGNAQVSVICTISTAASALEETKSTLRFASRIKQVVLSAQANEVVDERALLTQYRKQILELQAELARKNSEAAAIPPTPQRLSSDHRSKKMSDEFKKQADALKRQISSLQTLFVNAKNIDDVREAHSVTVPLPNADGMDEKERLIEELLDANDRIASLSDQNSRLQEELKYLRHEIQQRPAFAADAATDLKNERIQMLEKTVRELEVVIFNEDTQEARRQERRTVERELGGRLRALEREKQDQARVQATLTKDLLIDRKRIKALENFIMEHLEKEASQLSRRDSTVSLHETMVALTADDEDLETW